MTQRGVDSPFSLIDFFAADFRDRVAKAASPSSGSNRVIVDVRFARSKLGTELSSH